MFCEDGKKVSTRKGAEHIIYIYIYISVCEMYSESALRSSHTSRFSHLLTVPGRVKANLRSIPFHSYQHLRIISVGAQLVDGEAKQGNHQANESEVCIASQWFLSGMWLIHPTYRHFPVRQSVSIKI